MSTSATAWDKSLLTWEGQIISQNDESLQCRRLELHADNQARVSECGSMGKLMQFTAQRGREWAEMTEFDAWLYGLTSYSKGANYFEGAGTREPRAMEIEAMDNTEYLFLRPAKES